MYDDELNALQREEMLLINKLNYIADHYWEGIMGKDLVSKTVLLSLGKDVLLALGALNADDYGTREAASKPFDKLRGSY